MLKPILGENKKKIVNVSSGELAQTVVKVNNKPVSCVLSDET